MMMVLITQFRDIGTTNGEVPIGANEFSSSKVITYNFFRKIVLYFIHNVSHEF